MKDWEIISADSHIAFSAAGDRFEDPEHIRTRGTTEEVRPGGYDPHERIKYMALDGVQRDVVYPSAGLQLYEVRDSTLLSSIFRSYNDWIAEYCSAYPDRLKGIAMINVDDPQEGVEELQRVAKLGLAGAMISSYPKEDGQYDNPVYEPFWAAAQDLNMPLSLHIFTNRVEKELDKITAAYRSAFDVWPKLSIGNLIFSSVFERYPGLKVGIVEFEMG